MIKGYKLGIIVNVVIIYVVGTKVALYVGSTVEKGNVLIGEDTVGVVVALCMKIDARADVTLLRVDSIRAEVNLLIVKGVWK